MRSGESARYPVLCTVVGEEYKVRYSVQRYHS